MTERASDIAKRAAAVRTLAKSDSVVEAKNEAERIEALATTLDEKLIVIKLHHHLGVHHRALKMADEILAKQPELFHVRRDAITYYISKRDVVGARKHLDVAAATKEVTSDELAEISDYYGAVARTTRGR
jgi:hypothetical protein